MILGWRDFSFFRKLRENDVVRFSFAVNPFRLILRIPEVYLRDEHLSDVEVQDRKRKAIEYGAHAQWKKAKKNNIAEECQGLAQQQVNIGNEGSFCFGEGARSSKELKTQLEQRQINYAGYLAAEYLAKRHPNYKRGAHFGDQGGLDGSKGRSVPDRLKYNSDGILDAKFFVIKVHGEYNVQLSVQNNVWTSTYPGNTKLNAAFKEAKGKPYKCPVFLLFSVNASGKFMGVAEMIGPVDFTKTMDFWQHGNWTGCFPVKWHVIKDVPNRLLKHIVLKNNNRPVTRCRDTQEVQFEQGMEVLHIFNSHVPETSTGNSMAGR